MRKCPVKQNSVEVEQRTLTAMPHSSASHLLASLASSFVQKHRADTLYIMVKYSRDASTEIYHLWSDEK